MKTMNLVRTLLMAVGMGMLVGVRHAIVGMLVGMGMFVAVRATGNMIMVDMHILSPCVFYSIIPKNHRDFKKISKNIIKNACNLA